ncbi:MAG: flagellar assembly protein FliW [Planctomycetes bacterium]|nr:flagellar assembly protein FliW [Planctomycetota bacterium]
MTTKFATKRFQTIEFAEEQVVTFPEGLLGFAGYRRYIILENPTGGPLMWLQSVEDGNLAFIIASPTLFKPDYKIDLRPEDAEALKLAELEDGKVYTIMVVPKDNPRAMTANLQGPLVVNDKLGIGRQLVLSNSEYGTKYRVFQGEG